jgi:hypothetical protein
VWSAALLIAAIVGLAFYYVATTESSDACAANHVPFHPATVLVSLNYSGFHANSSAEACADTI